jgi:CHAT domain/SIR2-like domain
MPPPVLEIELTYRDTASYSARLRFVPPGAGAPIEECAPVRFDPGPLAAAAADPPRYGLALGGSLLGNSALGRILVAARAAAGESALRIRLAIDSESKRLHRLRWETLRDPADGRSLVMDQKIWFSRHLGSSDMRPIRLRTGTNLRVLVAVASPSNIELYSPGGKPLAAIDRDTEAAMVQSALANAPRGRVGKVEVCPARLPELKQRLREEFDILYLACHGVLQDDEPRLLFEGEDGAVFPVSGADLVTEFDRLLKPPRLVILASCQSAGGANDTRPDQAGTFAAGLGPRLAQHGIPAVVAMLGDVYVETVQTFMPAFLAELMKDGQVDRALAEARNTISARPDFWAPVLFTRLVDGVLWYDRGGGPGGKSLESWPKLIDQIKNKRCVPVIGSGLLEPYVGTSLESAARLAKDVRYPLSTSLSIELTQVTQYLSTTNGRMFTRGEYVKDLTKKIEEQFPALDVPPALEIEDDYTDDVEVRRLNALSDRLRVLFSAAASRLVTRGDLEPHRVLAELDCPLYVTTNPDTLLIDALKAAGKEPIELLYRWRTIPIDRPDPEEPLSPSIKAPIVYQLFGNFRDIGSLVLTEDDYFTYLLSLNSLRDKASLAHRRALLANRLLASSALMFLGFRVEDWDFRVFFHFLMNRESRELPSALERKHIAVQVDPEDGRNIEPARVRQYLERRFGAEKVDLYWGGAEDFLLELGERWKARPVQ